MSVLENSAWADEISSKDALTGSASISSMIKELQKNGRFLEVSAISVDWIWDQMCLHIPYKIGIDPSDHVLPKHTNDDEDEQKPKPVKLFSPLSSRRSSSSPAKPPTPAQQQLIEENIDPLEFLAALMTLHSLWGSVEHLKITGKGWPKYPGEDNNDDKSSSSTPSKNTPIKKNDGISPKPSSKSITEITNTPNGSAVVNDADENDEELTFKSITVHLTLFPKVSILEIESVPPENLRSLESLLPQLRLLKFEKSCIFDIKCVIPPKLDFHSMTHLKLSFCMLDELSKLKATKSSPSPLSSLINLKSLNLSHNNILNYKTIFAGVAVLTKLEKIDVSYNKISSMKDCFLMLGNVKSLLLSGNRLSHGAGIDRLWSLEKLALDGNKINALSDIVSISRLPCLMDLEIKDNPICLKLPTYRISILNLFREKRSSDNDVDGVVTTLEAIQLPTLDFLPATRKELNKLKDLTFTETVVNMEGIEASVENEQTVVDEDATSGGISSGSDDDDVSVASVSSAMSYDTQGSTTSLAERRKRRQRTKKSKSKTATITDGSPKTAVDVLQGVVDNKGEEDDRRSELHSFSTISMEPEGGARVKKKKKKKRGGSKNEAIIINNSQFDSENDGSDVVEASVDADAGNASRVESETTETATSKTKAVADAGADVDADGSLNEKKKPVISSAAEARKQARQRRRSSLKKKMDCLKETITTLESPGATSPTSFGVDNSVYLTPEVAITTKTTTTTTSNTNTTTTTTTNTTTNTTADEDVNSGFPDTPTDTEGLILVQTGELIIEDPVVTAGVSNINLNLDLEEEVSKTSTQETTPISPTSTTSTPSKSKKRLVPISNEEEENAAQPNASLNSNPPSPQEMVTEMAPSEYSINTSKPTIQPTVTPKNNGYDEFLEEFWSTGTATTSTGVLNHRNSFSTVVTTTTEGTDNLTLMGAENYSDGFKRISHGYNGGDSFSHQESLNCADSDDYCGPLTHAGTLVSSNYELYFKSHVFGVSGNDDSITDLNATYEDAGGVVDLGFNANDSSDRSRSSSVSAAPKINFTPTADVIQMKPPIDTETEKCLCLFAEEIVPCGNRATNVIPPVIVSERDFHGSENSQKKKGIDAQRCLIVVSDVNFYLFSMDSLGIEESATFGDGLRPWCVFCRPLHMLTRLSIGFGFQRLLVVFEGGFTFAVLTADKMQTYR